MLGLPAPRFDEFPRYEALTRLLFAYAEARPNLVSVRSMGKSHEGRDIWLVVLTNTATGLDTDKPAFWLDGNIHAAELLACNACLYYLNELVLKHGRDPQVTRLLDTRCVYMVPRLNPDGAELALADRPRHIRSSTRRYPLDEAPVDGLTMEDVDGDGRILTMRLPDPHGAYKKHPTEPRLMVAREPGEFGGEYYRLLPEGFIVNHDGLTVRVNPDAEGLDLNRNFPARWRQECEQVGAGPYPTSEPEVRAMVDFITQHPNIGAAVSFHTHSGVILRPSGHQPDADMTPEDLWLIQRLSRLGQQHTGYPVISSWHDFRYHPKETLAGTQEWLYEHLGALFWVVELWSPKRAAGVPDDSGWIDWLREHPVADDLTLLQWSDTQCGGKAYVDWKPYQHPQLGQVEIGGWDKMNFWRNPPPYLREAEVARFPAWLNQITLSLPRLELLRTEVRALGPDVWRVRLAVGNSGYLSAYVTQRALQRKVVRGVVFELYASAGVEVQMLQGKPRMEGPQLEGHAPRQSPLAFLPDRQPTADRALAEWVLRAPKGTALTLVAHAARAGTVRTEVTLD
ncbi:M14 family metallopeptidase [Roseateles sp. BYS180W]|uniref:M14 family metallopeptidase n=1 Tax=Roseateles rivi TaxID=3299028 RepID=A0ABW7FTD1_9BURK